MKNAKKEYVPPAAEVILLAPSETLAAWDWDFGNVWKSAGYHPPGTDTASAVVITGAFGSGENWDEGDGFVIKRNS